jgi:hypothetical protein
VSTSNDDAIDNLHAEIEASTLHPISKSFLLGLRRGADGYELPRDAATDLIDDLFVQARSGKSLGPILAELLYFAKGYETELGSPAVGLDLGQAINALADKLRHADSEQATAQKNARTMLGDAPPPPSRTREQAPAAIPSFKPWEILRKK